MTRLVVFTDIHYRMGRDRFGHDPDDRLAAGLAHAASVAPDADIIVIAGDLTHSGDAGSYARLKARLRHAHAPVALMIGNHDDRESFLRCFPDAPVDGGYVQQIIDLPEARLLLLDTHDEHRAGGAGWLCKSRLAWLEAALADTSDPCVIVMHHPPHDTGFAAMDALKLANGPDFFGVLERSNRRVQIICGHVHRTISGHFRGYPFAVLHSTVGQMPLDFAGSDATVEADDPPGFAIIDILKDGLTIQSELFDV